MKSFLTVFVMMMLLIFTTSAMAQLSGGTYQIDQTASGSDLYPTGDSFNSFADAITVLETIGVGGAIRFDVAAGQVFNENIELTSPFAGVGPRNTVIFRYLGDPDTKPVLRPDSDPPESLAGVIDVRFDGNFYVTFQGLSIDATATNGTVYRRGVRLVWGPDHVNIYDCDVYDFDTDGIVVYWGGGGEQANACEYVNVHGNKVYHEDLTTTPRSTIQGIMVSGGDSVVVSNNAVYDLLAGSSEIWGIRSSGISDTNFVDIFNNYVGLGANRTDDIDIRGIFTQHAAGSDVNVYNNSVFISGAVDNATNFTSAIRLNNNSNTNHYGNIAYNERTNTLGTANHYALYVNNSSVQYTGDYNILYVTGSFLAYRNTPIGTMASWQSLWGQDLNSLNEDPVFISQDDPHVRPNSPAANAGTPIAMVTDDIDNDVRDLGNPDIGADEFPDNTGPSITSNGPSPTLEGELYTYQVMVDDPDYGDIITYEFTQAPAFLSIDSTGLVSGTPADGDVATHTVSILVTDLSGETDTESYQLTVQEVNSAPTISDIPDAEIDEDGVLGPVAFTVDDVDDPNGSLSLSGVSDNQALVPNVNIDFGGSGSNRTITVTPVANQNGVANITVTVDDGDLTGTDVFELTVNAVNDAPVVTDIPGQTIDEGQSLVTINLDDFVSDIDNTDAEMSWNYTGNTDLTIDITDRVATITPPDENWNGSETITFTANDPGSLSDNDDATFTINAINDAPVVSDIPDQSVAEGATFTTISLDDFVNDVDNTDAQLTWSATGNTELTVDITARVATITIPNEEWSGEETITFRATDPGTLFGEDGATFTVTAVNDAPEVADIPDQSVAEGATFTTINLDDFVSDIDNTDAEMTWTATGNSELSVDITARVATITIPDENWNGSETITFRATDPGDAFDEDGSTFEVTAINDAPVVADIPDQTIPEGSAFTTINLDDFVSDVDNADTDMTWTSTGNTELTVDITDRVATITMPDINWNGTETITFRATDPGTLFDEDGATFAVTAEADAPIVTDIPDQSIAEGATFTTIALDDFVSDVDNTDAEMTWTASGNTDLTVDITDRVATITIPDENWNGEETITFRATDPTNLFDEDAATFTVTAVNDAPVVADIPDQTIAEGETFTTISLDDFVNDLDNADDEMTWTTTGNTELTVDITDRVATISIPNIDWNGDETITFRATDPGDEFGEDGATFTVTAVNDAPVVTDIPDQDISEGQTFTTITLDDFVSDVDNPDTDMAWTATGNTDLTVTITDRVATITMPDANWNGSETLTFRATDLLDAFDEDTASFTVSAENDAPVVSDIPDQDIAEGESFTTINLDNFVGDVDNSDAEMTWTATGNTELTVDITDRVATITIPNENWFGSETVTFRATDPGTLFGEDAATFSVNNVNDPPVFADIEGLNFDEDDSLSFAISDLYDLVDDPDHHDTLLQFIPLQMGEHVTIELDGTENLKLKAPAHFFGNDTLVIMATDGELADTALVLVTVNSVNDLPFIEGMEDTLEIVVQQQSSLRMSDFVKDNDLPRDSLRWEWDVDPEGGVELEFNPETTNLTITTPEDEGEFVVSFSVTDDSGAVAAGSFVVDVVLVSGLESDLTAAGVPTTYVLENNYPNPFNPTTNIKFGMPKAGRVVVEVYNLLGQKIVTLLDGHKAAGYHLVQFEAYNLPTGMYFYRIQTEKFHMVKKMMLIK